MRNRRPTPQVVPTPDHAWAVGDRVLFSGMGALQRGTIVRIMPSGIIKVEWTAASSGKTRIRSYRPEGAALWLQFLGAAR